MGIANFSHAASSIAHHSTDVQSVETVPALPTNRSWWEWGCGCSCRCRLCNGFSPSVAWVVQMPWPTTFINILTSDTLLLIRLLFWCWTFLLRIILKLSSETFSRALTNDSHILLHLILQGTFVWLANLAKVLTNGNLIQSNNQAIAQKWCHAFGIWWVGTELTILYHKYWKPFLGLMRVAAPTNSTGVRTIWSFTHCSYCCCWCQWLCAMEQSFQTSQAYKAPLNDLTQTPNQRECGTFFG